MDSVILILGWAGIVSPLVLGAVGSVYGCLIAGQAACGALLEVESGYGRYIGLTALPSSQTIYGIVVMLSLSGVAVTAAHAPALAAIGILSGVGLMVSASSQGKAIASAINLKAVKSLASL